VLESEIARLALISHQLKRAEKIWPVLKQSGVLIETHESEGPFREF
jgi:hypothetical protein